MTVEELYETAERKQISVNTYAMPGIPSLTVEDADGEYHIALDYRTISTSITERVSLAHELSHCDAGAFYTQDTPPTERSRTEYRANKLAVAYLVPWEAYAAAVMDGCFSKYEQSEYWEIPEEYVDTVHTVYERTRWDDVQRLKHKARKKWSDL